MDADKQLSAFYQRLQVQFESLPDLAPAELEIYEFHFDSIDLLRLLIWIDELAGVSLPDLNPPVLVSVGDAYRYYVRQLQSQDAEA